MSDNGERPTTARGRLTSLFDPLPPGTPLSLDDLELAMSSDLERRALAALDRALVRLAAAPISAGTAGSEAALLAAPDTAEAYERTASQQEDRP